MCQSITSHHSEYIYTLLICVFFSGDPGFEQMENVDPANIPLPDDAFIPPRDIKLPLFWQSRLAAWFVFVESRFRLHNTRGRDSKIRSRAVCSP
jgi:hypothetical protein